jgi:hypothetical protein
MGSYKHRHALLSLSEQSDRLLALTDDQIRILFQPSGDNRQHYTLKKWAAPFLQSQITNLYLFTPEFQRLALEIQAKVGAINEGIDKAWFNYTKTFEAGLSSQNHSIVEGNMYQANMNTAKFCHEVCDDIVELLSRKR